jgi:hypothetical protein
MEDTKCVIRNMKAKKNRQCNDHKKKKRLELPQEHANMTFQDPRWRQTANGLPVM